jgi:hypothetical protein
MGRRFAYLLTGYAAGALVGLALWVFTGKFYVWLAFIVGNTLGVLFTVRAERAGKVKTVDELNRPLTIFGRD